MSAETDIAAIDDGGENTAAEVRTALTSVLQSDVPYLDLRPASAHSKDDEFDGTSLDGKWTSPANSSSSPSLAVSTTLRNSVLVLEPAATGNGSIATYGPFGIRQAAPTGDFTLSAKIAIQGSTAGAADHRAGIFVADTTDNKAYLAGQQESAFVMFDYVGITSFSLTSQWNVYDGTVVSFNSGKLIPGDWTWIRLVWASPTLSVYHSTNGATWHDVAFATDTITQPEYIGLAIYSNTSGMRYDFKLMCDWFRVTE